MKILTLKIQILDKYKWLPECDVIFNFAAESDVDIGNQSCDNL